MRAKTHQSNYILILINPYQKEIPFDMTFHISLVIACQRMRSGLNRQKTFIGNIRKNLCQLLKFSGLIADTLKVFLELACLP